jgi:hypothetical protein
VDGEFNGCEHGKRIKLQNGSVFACAEYSYTYSYSPDVIVLGKQANLGGRQFIMIKLLIEGEVFDMSPVAP